MNWSLALKEGPDDEAQAVYRRADHRGAEGARAGGEDGSDLCRKHGISEATFYNWKSKYGGMEVSEAKRLKALERREHQAEEAVGRCHARQRGVEGPAGKKMVTPAVKREAVAHLKAAHEMSERRACRIDRLRPDDGALPLAAPGRSGIARAARALAKERRRFGYRRLLIFLRREGFVVNHKRLFRIYREERLMVRKRGGRKRALGTRTPMPVAHCRMTAGRSTSSPISSSTAAASASSASTTTAPGSAWRWCRYLDLRHPVPLSSRVPPHGSSRAWL